MPKHGVWGWHEFVAHIVINRLRVDFPLDFRRLQDRLDFRGKDKFGMVPVIVQRFNAQAITGQKQLTLVLIPDDKSEHAIKLLYARWPILLIGMYDHLSVGAAAKDMAFGFQYLAQFEEVVDFPVVSDPHRTIFIRHRLTAMFAQIDNTETSMTERHPRIGIQPVLVGTAMGKGLCHLAHQGLILPRKPCNTAHRH